MATRSPLAYVARRLQRPRQPPRPYNSFRVGKNGLRHCGLWICGSRKRPTPFYIADRPTGRPWYIASYDFHSAQLRPTLSQSRAYEGERFILASAVSALRPPPAELLQSSSPVTSATWSPRRVQDVFHYRPLTRLSFKVLTQTHRSVLDDAYGTLPAVPAEYAELTLPAEYKIHDRSIRSATTGPSGGTEQPSTAVEQSTALSV